VTIQTDGPSFEAVPDDARITLCYLNATESADYIAVMDVLEASINDLSPAQVASALAAAGRYLPADVVENRLESLRDWRAITGTQDTSRILRHSDLLLRNRRYARTQAGRQIHRFYPPLADKVLVSTLDSSAEAIYRQLRIDGWLIHPAVEAAQMLTSTVEPPEAGTPVAT